MKKFTVATLIVTFALSMLAATAADAGIFGRGRGIFRGRWGSRNTGSCGAACSPGTACGPAGCSLSSSPKKAAAPAATVTMPVSP